MKNFPKKLIPATLALGIFLSLPALAKEAAEGKGTCSPYLRAKNKTACEKMSRPKAEQDIPAKICTWNEDAEDKCECCIYNSEE